LNQSKKNKFLEPTNNDKKEPLTQYENWQYTY